MIGRMRTIGDIQNKDGVIVFPQVWASVRSARGRENVAGEQVRSNVSHTLMFHWRPGVDATQRYVVGERVFHFAYVVNVDEKNQYLEIGATEAATNG